ASGPSLYTSRSGMPMVLPYRVCLWGEIVPTSREDVAHLLRRAGFGGLPSEIDALVPLDLPEVVERVLDLSAAPAVVPPAEPAVIPVSEYNRWVAVHHWWIERMRTTPAPM